MKAKRKAAGLLSLVLGLGLSQGVLPAAVWAGADSAAVQSEAPSNYALTGDIRAALKDVAAVPTGNGTQLSAVVRVYNGGSKKNRLPEHELRVRTSGGVTYTLTASAANKGALEPKEISELVYMAVIDTKEIGDINQVSFVNVDNYSYPKVETTLLSMTPASVWYGTSAKRTPKALEWGTPFTIPGLNSDIEYTPVDASAQRTSTGTAAVVTLLAHNPADGREDVPDFRLDAQADGSVYTGKISETGPISLEAGESKYVHVTVPVGNSEDITKLYLMVQDSYTAKAGGQATVLSTGKLVFDWPEQQVSQGAAAAYSYGQPIAFDPLSKLVAKTTQVSLMELHIHDNPGEGYKTALAKFKLTNNGDKPVAAPAFLAELRNADGTVYQGVRQTGAAATLNPKLGYVASYSFILPKSEDSASYTLNLLDNQTIAPFTTKIASIQTPLQDEAKDGTVDLYPFQIKFNDVTMSYQYANLTYSLKFMLDLTIKQKDDVVVGSSFSQIRFEIVDHADRIVGTKDVPLTGANKLINGVQYLKTDITTEMLSSPYTVNIYEIINTDNGVAKRLLKSYPNM